MERYPLRVTGVQKVCVLEQQNDMIGLYLWYPEGDLHDTDAALVIDINTVALDLTEAAENRVTGAGRRAFLLWSQLTKEQARLFLRQRHNHKCDLSTWEELTS